jgi:hypothetical protein
MEVIDELLGPGMQDSEHADGGADVSWITGDWGAARIIETPG